MLSYVKKHTGDHHHRRRRSLCSDSSSSRTSAASVGARRRWSGLISGAIGGVTMLCVSLVQERRSAPCPPAWPDASPSSLRAASRRATPRQCAPLFRRTPRPSFAARHAPRRRPRTGESRLDRHSFSLSAACAARPVARPSPRLLMRRPISTRARPSPSWSASRRPAATTSMRARSPATSASTFPAIPT